ncbi:head-to-tail connector protein [Vibrio phage vB_VpP_DE10]|uniref:Head-to-tail connector protein n=1 Tax=Vibrio phage vB_VpP_DE10 TaxID=2861001 RepID=A0AAE7VK09_9CAUD|nr:head-to-tail connector protein [Vibrio phage vB_VpP_DE10]
MHTQETHEALFAKYEDSEVTLSSERYAFWTVPTVFTRENKDGERVSLQRDFQSHGAMLVNNLASKLTRTLFPTGMSFFRISDTDKMREIIAQLGNDNAQLSAVFTGIEREAMTLLTTHAGFAQLTHLMKLLIITGNALLYRDPLTGRMTVYSVRDYVVRRDGASRVLCTILRERIPIQDVPEEFRPTGYTDPTTDVWLYTKIQRETRDAGDVFVITQQIDGKPVGTLSVYPEKLCPYIPAVWNLVSGEHYGRGHVEDHAGAFARVSELTQALTLYEIEAMRVVNLVSPKSTADVDALNDAETGEYVAGDGEGIKAHEAGEARKIAEVVNDLQMVLAELARAFMYTGNVRDAERVTAEEIKNNVREAEENMGGIYATLAEILHIPLAHILTVEARPELLALLQANAVSLDIQVGTAAINRSIVVQRLGLVANDINLILPVLAQATKRTNPDRVIDLILAGHGVDPTEIFYTEQELQQLQAAEEAAAQAPASGMALDAGSAALLSEQQGLTQ